MDSSSGFSQLVIQELSGINTNNLRTDMIDTGTITASDDISTNGNLQAGSSLFVGSGGIMSGGGLAILSTTSTSTFAGALQVNNSLILPLNSSPRVTANAINNILTNN